MDTWPLMDYQKKSCPLCLANLPHEAHRTALELAQTGLQIVEVSPGDVSSVFEGTHAIERHKAPAA